MLLNEQISQLKISFEIETETVKAEFNAEKESITKLLEFQDKIQNTISQLKSDIIIQNDLISNVNLLKTILEGEKESLDSTLKSTLRQVDHLHKELKTKEDEISRKEIESRVLVQHMEDTSESRDHLHRENELLVDQLR